MKFRIAFVVLAALAPILSFADASEDAKGVALDDCKDLNNCSIEYDHLATQETDPFLFLGRLLDENHPQWKKYSKLLKRFPDVSSCLEGSQAQKAHPNLLLVDWEKTGLGRGAQICMYRIGRSLGTTERLRMWLDFHDFSIGPKGRFRSANYKPSFDTDPIGNMSAYWTTEQYREKDPSWFVSLTGIELLLRFEFVFIFSEMDDLVGVGIATPSK